MNRTRKITFIGILSSLAIVATLFEIQYPFVAWLKFDLSETVILYAVSFLGLPAAIAIGFIKTLIQLFTGDATPFNIGELTALIASLSFAISFYLTKKWNIVLRLITVSLFFTTVMVIFNFFISTPVYITQSFNYNNIIEMGFGTKVFGKEFVVTDTFSYLILILVMYVPFNFIKAAIISTVYILTEPILKRAFNQITNK